MSNVQRVAGSLFTKMRDVRTGLLLVDRDVNLMTNRLDQVTVQLELLTLQLDVHRKRNQMWFILIVGINIGIYLSVVFMLGMLGYYSTWVLKYCNVTDDHHHETVMDRSDVRIIAEWFAWLFVRPWLN